MKEKEPNASKKKRKKNFQAVKLQPIRVARAEPQVKTNETFCVASSRMANFGSAEGSRVYARFSVPHMPPFSTAGAPGEAVI